MAGLAIEPDRRGEEQKLSDALHKLVAEDPCVRVEHHSSLNETVLYGMGDLHLRVGVTGVVRSIRLDIRRPGPGTDLARIRT